MSALRTVFALVCIPFAVACYASESKPEEPKQDEHPLTPLIRFAEGRLRWLEAVKDYTCTVTKRERLDGHLQQMRSMEVKIRHSQTHDGREVAPFSVYLRYLSPSDVAGREVVYVQGAHKGRMIVRRGGPRFPSMTLSIAPDSFAAMQESRSPITEVGVKSAIVKMLDIARHDLQYGECEVKYYVGAKVNERVCTVVQITHPVQRSHFLYHVAQIFIDDEFGLPIRYAVHDWPEEPGGAPSLMEEYTILKLRLNAGLADTDFDHRNPAYGFRKEFQPDEG